MLVTSIFSFFHHIIYFFLILAMFNFAVNKSMGECNTILSDYTLYRYLG